MPPSLKTELHYLVALPNVPNLKMPVLVYRVFFDDFETENIRTTITSNGWVLGGYWGAYYDVHFHSNTHELYVVISGEGTFILGGSTGESQKDEHGQDVGLKVRLRRGDAIALPSGVSHALIEPDSYWQVVTFYPFGSPAWNMNYCKESPEETNKIARDCEAVPIPDCDPFRGASGPLLEAWADGTSSDGLGKSAM